MQFGLVVLVEGLALGVFEVFGVDRVVRAYVGLGMLGLARRQSMRG